MQVNIRGNDFKRSAKNPAQTKRRDDSNWKRDPTSITSSHHLYVCAMTCAHFALCSGNGSFRTSDVPSVNRIRRGGCCIRMRYRGNNGVWFLVRAWIWNCVFHSWRRRDWGDRDGQFLVNTTQWHVYPETEHRFLQTGGSGRYDLPMPSATTETRENWAIKGRLYN